MTWLKWRIRKRHFLSKIKGSVSGGNSVQSVVAKVGKDGGNQVVAEDPPKVPQDPRKHREVGLYDFWVSVLESSGGIETSIDNIKAWDNHPSPTLAFEHV